MNKTTMNARVLQELEPPELRLVLAVIDRALADMEDDSLSREEQIKALLWVTENPFEELLDIDFYGLAYAWMKGDPKGIRLLLKKRRTTHAEK